MPDPLTGLPTHRDLGAHLPAAVTSALWMDIDGLIWVNDQSGFEAGHRAIASVAEALRATFAPTTARLFRVAGDELLALLDRLDQRAAAVLAERAMSAVDALAIPYHRPDRVGPDHLRINIAVLALDPASLSRSLGKHGLGDPLHDVLADAVYREKLRRKVPAGVIVQVPSE